MSRDGAPKPGTMQERAQVAAVEFVRGTTYTTGDWRDALVKFAAAEVAEAIAAEREACAAWFADMGSLPGPNVAAAIRARSKT